MEKQYDIIIIGGGLLGCATAYQLAQRQAGSIALWERNDIASQASSRAACLLTRARTKRVLMPIVQETYDCIEAIERLTGESLGLQMCGSITIASSAASQKGLDELEAAANSFGIPNEHLSKERVKELLPWIATEPVDDALYMPTDAFIDSAVLCSGYAQAARMLGVDIYSHTDVREICCPSQKVAGVRLADGSLLAAGTVVTAAGAWSNLLLKPLGAGLPFTPVRSHFWITELDPVKFPVNHPFTVIPDARAFTRSDVGALIIGLRESTCVPFDPSSLTPSLEDFDCEANGQWTVLDECAPAFKAYLPEIDETGIAHYVAGPSCYVPDALFIIGKVPPIEGLYTVSGCCGAGVAAGGGMGRLAAEMILGQETFVDACCFAPDRFGQIDPFDAGFQRKCADARSNKKGG